MTLTGWRRDALTIVVIALFSLDFWLVLFVGWYLAGRP